MPSWIPTRQFRTWPRGGEGESRLVDFPLVNSREAVLWMVQMHCIDMNAWYSRIDQPDRPDFVLFDLDPPEAPDAFPLCVRVAHVVREALAGARPRVVGEDERRRRHPRPRPDRAPLDLRRDVRVRRAARAPARGGASRRGDDRVAEEEARRACSSTTARTATGRRSRRSTRCGRSPARRSRRRSRWDELTEEIRPRDFTMERALERVAAHGDLFEPVLHGKQALGPALKALR